MYPIVKRFFDFSVALTLLITVSPLLIFITTLQLLFNKGVVFYLQERIGKDYQRFRIFKFATMRANSLSTGYRTVTLKNDPRVTLLGKYLRKSKLNELPQLLNVIKGEMSFVGPRPLLPASFRKYSIEVQNSISQCRPGITGIGSVVFRDEESLVSKVRDMGFDPLDYYQAYIYPYKGHLEKWYLINRSFVTDLKLLFLTITVIIVPKVDYVYRIFRSLPAKPENLLVSNITREALQNMIS